RQIFSRPEHRHIRMAEALRPLVFDTEQHVDQMSGTKTLAGTVNRGKRLDRGFRAVPGLDRLQTGIAVAAPAGMRLTEVGEDRLAPAARRFADRKQRIELGPLDALHLLGRIA